MTPVNGNPRPDHSSDRHRFAHPALALLIAAVALLMAACANGQGDAPDTTTPALASPTSEAASPTAGADATAPASSPTAAATPFPQQEMLEQMVLQADELPGQLLRVSAVTSPNEDVASASPDPTAELAQLESWGRVLGYDVTFQPGPESPPDITIRGVNSTASLYLTPDGASASFADGAETARTQDWAISYPSLTGLQVREIDRPNLADEVLWIRVSGFQGEENGFILIDDFVLLRRDRVRAFLRLTSLFPASASQDAFLEDTSALAALQVEHIDAALPGT